MITLTQNFKIEDVFNDIDNFLDDRLDLLVQDLKNTGKKMVDKARAQTAAEQGFNNITWNLRASIGCVVVRDHDIVFTYFPPIKDGAEGQKNGPAYAQEIASLIDDGEIMLILVAGMQYAEAVEAKGKDVITHASKSFEEFFRKEYRSLA